MQTDWVAATVRARSMAQRRAGAGTCRSVAAAPGLPAAVELLAGTMYADRLASAGTLSRAQQETRGAVLWQLRVLAGWVPPAGTRLVRAAAAGFEAHNIRVLAARLGAGGGTASETGTSETGSTGGGDYFDLGSLATAWPRLSTADSPEALASILAASPWGDPGPAETLPDVLTVVWLRRLASVAPRARPWAAAAGALTAARLLLVDRLVPSGRLMALLRPLIGTRWTETGSLPDLASSLPPGAARTLRDSSEPSELWRAEAAAAAQVEADGFGLLRGGLPGPDMVLGAMAVLAADAWRVRAALAAAAAGAGESEVLNAVA